MTHGSVRRAVFPPPKCVYLPMTANRSDDERGGVVRHA